MEYWIIIILGIVQGACEFLPVSSSGHLVVFYNFLGIYDNTIFLSIVLHLATLLAVVLVYRKQIWQLIKKPFCKTNIMLLMSTVATLVIVIIFKTFIEDSFTGSMVIICFGITAIFLVAGELIGKVVRKKQNIPDICTSSSDFVSETDITNIPIHYWQAVVIGLMQGVATLTGISRSGTTIATGLAVGVPKERVAHYSFLLSVPIILASFIYEIWEMSKESVVLQFSFGQLLVGFIVTFIVGLICLKAMIKFVKNQKLYIFSIYLVVLIIFLLLNKYVFLWF